MSIPPEVVQAGVTAILGFKDRQIAELRAAAKLGLAYMECERDSLLESHCILVNGEPDLSTLDEMVKPYMENLDAHIADVRAAINAALPQGRKT